MVVAPFDIDGAGWSLPSPVGAFVAIWAAQAFTRDWIHLQRLLATAVFSQ